MDGVAHEKGQVPASGSDSGGSLRRRYAGGLRIEYAPRFDTTQQSEIETLAFVYAFAIRRHEKKEAAEVGDAEQGAENVLPGNVPGEGQL